MNQFFNRLKEEGKKGGLTASEKAAMLARLRAEMKATSAGAPTSSPAPFLVRSPYAFIFSRAFFAPALFMLLVIGGATAYAAEGALPGDLLYPIKVSVNEPVRGALAFSAEAKAAWHAEAVGRRVREAETLALRGELSASKSAEIEADFDRHISLVEGFLGVVESSSPLKAAEISARFASSLASYGSDLLHAGLQSVDIATRKETDSLAEHVKTKQAQLVSPERAKAAVPARAKSKPSSAVPALGAPVSSEPINVSAVSPLMSLQTLEKEVVASLAEVQLAYDGLKPRLGSDASLEVERRVADIRNLLSQTDSLNDEKGTAASLARVQLALKHLAGLEAFLKSHQETVTAATSSAATSGSASGSVNAAPVPAIPVPPVISPQNYLPAGL